MSRQIGRPTAVIGFMTVLSRVSGLLRDKCIAFAFGAGALTDAFFVAYRIPDLLRGLLAEGSLSAAFVPLFAAEDRQHGRRAAFMLGSAALTVMAVVLAVVALLGVLVAPWLVQLFTLEFGPVQSPQFALTVSLT
ncbi:MAG TPA: lipid II flippase MurJ, partial [bacterium]|nr:lipid II flippase MurJ [bacterium]